MFHDEHLYFKGVITPLGLSLDLHPHIFVSVGSCRFQIERVFCIGLMAHQPKKWLRHGPEYGPTTSVILRLLGDGCGWLSVEVVLGLWATGGRR